MAQTAQTVSSTVTCCHNTQSQSGPRCMAINEVEEAPIGMGSKLPLAAPSDSLMAPTAQSGTSTVLHSMEGGSPTQTSLTISVSDHTLPYEFLLVSEFHSLPHLPSKLVALIGTRRIFSCSLTTMCHVFIRRPPAQVSSRRDRGQQLVAWQQSWTAKKAAISDHVRKYLPKI